jgi:hypothetical protein
MKFRPHRATLVEAMEHMVEFPDRAALVADIAKKMGPWGIKITDHDVRIAPYIFDARNGWNTHIVTVRTKPPDGFTVYGFTDGPCP